MLWERTTFSAIFNQPIVIELIWLQAKDARNSPEKEGQKIEEAPNLVTLLTVGFNVLNKKHEDFMTTGIIDSCKVVTALVEIAVYQAKAILRML